MKSKILLTRPLNLAIIGLTMGVILWRYCDELNPDYLLHCILLVTPAILTAAAGYVVNDIYDVQADRLNKPAKLHIGTSVSEKTAWTMYAVLSLLSLVCSFLYNTQYGTFNVCIMALLYFYSTTLKGMPLIGNIVVALCSAAVVACTVLVVAFDTSSAFMNFGGYIIFAFFISLIRELVKDIQDMEGDAAAGYKTYPIVAGVKGAKVIIYGFTGIQIILCGIYSFIAWGLADDMFTSSIIMGLITIGLFFFLNLLARAKTPDEFGKCSTLLKAFMFAGVINLIFS